MKGHSLGGSVEAAGSLYQFYSSSVTKVLLSTILTFVFEQVQDVLAKAEPPGKATVEGVEQIEEHPGYDDAVVDAQEAVHDETGYSYANEVWAYGIPGHDGPLLDGLTKGQLKVKERDAENEKHDKVGHQEGTCVCVCVRVSK